MKQNIERLFIPQHRIEVLSRRAVVARRVGQILFFALCSLWIWALPNVFFRYHAFESPAAVFLICIAGLAPAGMAAAATIKAIGGKQYFSEGDIAELSRGQLHLPGVLTVEATSIAKVRVRRYEGGCRDVLVRLRRGEEIRLTPKTESRGRQYERSEYCRLCELIYNTLNIKT